MPGTVSQCGSTAAKEDMANELKYGDKIHLQNGYDDFKGGYLDTLNHHTSAGLKHYVATADSPTRDTSGTGTWEVLSASGKAAGDPVVSGDLVRLRNLYAGDGGYLDTANHASTVQKSAGGKYDVATAESNNRASGSGQWRIFAQTSTPGDQNVRAGTSSTCGTPTTATAASWRPTSTPRATRRAANSTSAPTPTSTALPTSPTGRSTRPDHTSAPAPGEPAWGRGRLRSLQTEDGPSVCDGS
jgi:hypothetical protein